jgi:hypothetical protein
MQRLCVEGLLNVFRLCLGGHAVNPCCTCTILADCNLYSNAMNNLNDLTSSNNHRKSFVQPLGNKSI